MPAGGACQLYVYYRVVGDTGWARAAVGALLEAVAAKTGVAGRLLARCDDPAMWMEVYAPIANRADFDDNLAALVRELRVAAIAADGVRHTEWFGPLPDTLVAGVAPGA